MLRGKSRNNNPYEKAVFRQPFRTLLMIVLIGAVTYAFLSHTAEYLIVSKAIKYLTHYYQPIGWLDSADGDIIQGEKIVAQSPYVELEDIRRSCPGTLNGLYNADIVGMGLKFQSLANDVVFIGELQYTQYVKSQGNGGGLYQLGFKVNEILAAYPEYMEKGSTIRVKYMPGLEEYHGLEAYTPPKPGEEFMKEYHALETGRQYLIHAYYTELGGVNGIAADVMAGRAGDCFVLKPLLPSDYNFYFYPISENDNEKRLREKLPELSEYLDVMKNNQRAVTVIGTKDMSRMPECQESMKRYYLKEGRWLNKKDNNEKEKVCVIHSYLAQIRGLSVGDKIKIDLRNTEEKGYGYIFPEDWNNWENKEIKAEEFVITGIYDDFQTSNNFITIYSNLIFVPDSCIPKWHNLSDVLKKSGSNFYSFALREAKDKDKFLAENKKKLEKLGIRANFVENNAENFSLTAERLKQSAGTGLFVFGASMILILELSVFFYLFQRKREFSISRALGVPSRKAIREITAAAGIIGLPGIFFGGTAAWRNTRETAGKLLKSLEIEEILPENMAPSIVWLLAIIIGILFLFFTSIFAAAVFLSKVPILVLLQGGKEKRKKQKKDVEKQSKQETETRWEQKPERMITAGINSPLPHSKKAYFGALIRYTFFHQVRTKRKGILILAAAAGFTMSLGWMNWVIEKNQIETDRIYNTTEIEGEIIKVDSSSSYQEKGGGVITPETVEAVMEAGLVKEVYLEETAVAQEIYAQPGNGIYTSKGKEKSENISGVNNSAASERMAITNLSLLSVYQWERFITGTGQKITVKFLPGYNQDLFTSNKETSGFPAIVPEQMMQRLGVDLGDIVTLSTGDNAIIAMTYTIAGSYQGQLGNGVPADTVILPPAAMHELAGDNYNYLKAEFIFEPGKNRELLKNGEELKAKIAKKNTGSVDVRLIIWDEELHEVLEPMERTLFLLKTVYPAVSIIFTLLGCGISILFLLQRTKEAAVMRILGSSVKQIRCLFFVEQIAAYLFGIIIGILLLMFCCISITGSLILRFTALFIGAVVGAVWGSILLTNKQPIELLQTKE